MKNLMLGGPARLLEARDTGLQVGEASNHHILMTRARTVMAHSSTIPSLPPGRQPAEQADPRREAACFTHQCCHDRAFSHPDSSIPLSSSLHADSSEPRSKRSAALSTPIQPYSMITDDRDNEQYDTDDDTEVERRKRLVRRRAAALAKTGSLSLQSLLKHFLPLVPRRQGLLLCLLVRDVLLGELHLSNQDFQEHVRTVLCNDSISTLCQFTTLVAELQARRWRRPRLAAKFSNPHVRSNLTQHRCLAWPTL